MLCCTAGCSHISVCIAGQTMTGARVASSVLVSRSVDSPAVYAARTRAVAGTTMIRSARLAELRVRDRVFSSHRLVCTGSLASARQRRAADEVLGAPRHHRDDVRAGVDEPAADLDRLVRGDATGDAEDDPLPGERRCGAGHAASRERQASIRPSRRGDRLRRRRLAVGELGLGLDGASVHADDLVRRDLLEADAQRLAGDGADLRGHHVAEAVTELAEVRVDLPGTPRGERDQAELGVDPVEELLDRRVHHRVVRALHPCGLRAVRGTSASRHDPCWKDSLIVRDQRVAGPPFACSACVDDRQHLVDVVSRSSLTTTWSAIARPIGSSSSALRIRCSTLPSGHRARAAGGPAPPATAGARRSAPRRGMSAFTWRAPSTSISSTVSCPGGGSGFGVP